MNTKRLLNSGSIVLAGLGVIALCVGIHMAAKSKKNIKKVNKAIDDLADKTFVDISEEIIKKAAEKAADKAALNAIEIVRKDINVKVYNVVSSAYEHVEEEANNRLSKAIERDIDIDILKKKVENKASSAIVDKFMTNLDSYVGPIMNHIITAAERKGEQR